MTKSETVSRRGFLAAVGVGAAAAAIPASAVASVLPGCGLQSFAEPLLGSYRRELERLAARLRPGFESGKLHAMTDEELEDGQNGATAPMWEIERAAGEHFRLVDRDADEPYEGSTQTAYLVLAASPSAPFEDDGSWNHPAYAARSAAMWDVILLARERGWYTPSPTEQLGRDCEEDQELKAERHRRT